MSDYIGKFTFFPNDAFNINYRFRLDSENFSPNRVELGSMTTTQRDALSSPAAGTVIYNSTTNVAQVWNGAAWRDMSSGGIEGASGGTATPAPGGKVIRSFTSSGNFSYTSACLLYTSPSPRDRG